MRQMVKLTTSQYLDLAAMPYKRNSHSPIEAVVYVAGGYGRCRHYLLFNYATKTGKRHFEHCGIDDVWEKMSEKRFREFYGEYMWHVDPEDMPDDEIREKLMEMKS